MFSAKETVIIGGGLGGLTLALALNARGISCEVYELRSESYAHGGGIMLSPNALRVLDRLGVWDRARSRGFCFETLTFMTDDHDTIGKYCFGNEAMYGYPGFRIYRNDLLDVLRTLMKERGIPIHYEHKFSRVIEETAEGIKFALADGTTREAACLIGADGTHSKVRNYLTPDMAPKFAGALGVISSVPTAKLRLPSTDFPLPAHFLGKHGGFVMAPQGHQGSETFIGRQFLVEDRGRQGWDDLYNDKQQLSAMICGQKEEWSDAVQSAMEAIDPQQLNVWPFHLLPKLDRWYSQHGRVILVGDSAKTIPPTAGQGANLAFEDALTLAWVLGRSADGKSPTVDDLQKWLKYRQQRVDEVLVLNEKMGHMRLSLEQKTQMGIKIDPNFGKAENMGWLFAPDLEQEMQKVFDAA